MPPDTGILRQTMASYAPGFTLHIDGKPAFLIRTLIGEFIAPPGQGGEYRHRPARGEKLRMHLSPAAGLN